MMEITFPGGVAVNTEYKGFTTRTDQPEANGGSNSAPSPFDLFLSSLGACAGFFALRFCQQREINTTGMRLSLGTERNAESKRLDSIKIVIHLPEGFPQYCSQFICHIIWTCINRAFFCPCNICNIY